jgi:putative ABC transport system permease protein
MRELRDAVARRLAGMNLAPEREAEIIEELVDHLEQRRRELMAGGMSSERALRLVLADLGKTGALSRELRSTEQRVDPDAKVFGASGTDALRDLWHDLRYGLRTLRKNPAMSAIAIVTLALGIGANTSIFSVIDSVILQPLPVPHPEKLVMIWESRIREGVLNNAVSPMDFVDWQAAQKSFDNVAAFDEDSMDLTGTGEPERLVAGRVSPSFFRTLGIVPVIGRDFVLEETRGNHVVILSQGLWQRRFGGDPNIVGRTLTLSGESYEVIGVMPPTNETAVLWHPFDFNAELMRQRGSHFLGVYGRLKPTVTIEQAQADMDRIAAQIEKDVPGGNSGHGAHVISAHEFLVGDVRRPLNVLAAAVGFVLLIACANVANLLLARGVKWQRELTIRHALGASRLRMVRQFSMECLWLAFIGALAGLPIAVLGTDLLKAIAPVDIPRLAEASLDLRVLGYMSIVTLATAILAGIGPAFQVFRVDPNEALKETSPSVGGSRRRLRNALIVAEIALTFVLLTGAGLMGRSLLNILRVDPGFNPDNVFTIRIALSSLQTRNKPVGVFFTELMDRIRTIPGVVSVGTTSHLPLSGLDSRSGIVVEGLPPVAGQPTRAHPRIVSTDYFDTMKMRLREGRIPTDQEVRDQTPVVVINRTAALRYWPGQNPIGKRMQVLGYGAMREIIGIVDDVKFWGLSVPVNPEAYLPGLRSPVTVVVRTQGNAAGFAASIREQVRQLDSELPLSDVRTMEEVMGRSVTATKFYVILLSAFGFIAVVLAAAGIYGVISYTVSQGTRDIGVRIALGAGPVDVVKSVLGQGLGLSAVSVAIGIAASLGLTRLMKSLLFGVEAADPLTLAATGLITVAVALVACYMPARRASRIDPIVALRHQ